MQYGVHPAQGLRIVKRHYPTQFIAFKQLPTRFDANILADNVHKILHKSQPSKVKRLPAIVPDHFALNTIIPNNLNNVTGYVSPTQNVHPDIHFIRTQRRYNKRRYARVRAISRPPF